ATCAVAGALRPTSDASRTIEAVAAAKVTFMIGSTKINEPSFYAPEDYQPASGPLRLCNHRV
ncbi:hypothetical protein ABTE11_21705, partial [Acinetobacter baumannii]